MNEPSFLLATEDGLLTVDLDGKMIDQSLGGAGVVAVTLSEGRTIVATERQGVLIGERGKWVHAGLEEPTLWTIAAGPPAGKDGKPLIYAGTEPAAVWRHDDKSSWVELTGLDQVEEHDDWHSPWGAADLATIIVEEGRMIVGVEVGGVAVSNDGGQSWEARNEGLFTDVHHVIAYGETLYATTGGGLHVSNDEGRKWSWANEGLDRGYTQGIALSDGHILVASSSGPPPFWDSGGPEAAIFRAEITSEPLVFSPVVDGFAGNVGRQAMASSGPLVVAGTSEGEVLVSLDSGATFEDVGSGFPAINAVALVS